MVDIEPREATKIDRVLANLEAVQRKLNRSFEKNPKGHFSSFPPGKTAKREYEERRLKGVLASLMSGGKV